eukprot:4415-Heterococcus_DN1.PRE.1
MIPLPSLCVCGQTAHVESRLAFDRWKIIALIACLSGMHSSRTRGTTASLQLVLAAHIRASLQLAAAHELLAASIYTALRTGWRACHGPSGVADEQESQTSEQKGDRPKKRLVFVINAKGEEDLLLDSLLADGVHPGDLPQILTNEFSIRERTAMYKEGGVFIVTSRILIVDFLNNVVDPSSVSGFLVHHAHRVEETSTEAFILRIFRQKSRSGFVKGFCEDPEALTRGFGKAEKVLRALHVQKLYLWPRFQSE